MFKRILIANRGEIALRIIRACHELGVEAVCVYSTADKEAPYLRQADGVICIGPGPAKESYLNISRIIAAAEIADVDAIHPGYGFLSERPDFSQACRDCKIEFIGPSPRPWANSATRSSASTARAAGVPVFPGSDGRRGRRRGHPHRQRDRLPVIIKASAGGVGAACASATTKPPSAPASSRPSKRPPPPSATARSSSRSSSNTPATSRFSAWATSTATPSISGNATAPCSDATRRSSKKPRTQHRPRHSRSSASAARLIKSVNYHGRHLRVPHGRQAELLHAPRSTPACRSSTPSPR